MEELHSELGDMESGIGMCLDNVPDQLFYAEKASLSLSVLLNKSV